MRRSWPIAAGLGIAVAVALSASPQAGESGEISRGKYIVERVAMCQECHTPRDDKGDLDVGNWLRGGPHPYAPAKPTRDWVDAAPAIAGLPGWLKDEDAIQFLETGARPDGRRPRPPMKSYRMTRADAAAVVAYLRSLAKSSASPR